MWTRIECASQSVREENIQRNMIVLLIKYLNQDERIHYADVGAVQLQQKRKAGKWRE